MKKVLIIGGTGFIGSALCEHLQTEARVRLVGFFSKKGPIDVPKSVSFIVHTVDLEWFGNYVNPQNRIMDFNHLTKQELAKYDVVILLAAHCSVPMANNSPVLSTFNNNVRNFINLAGKISPHTKFIYAGSASVYNGCPLTAEETSDLRPPANIYDQTKQDIDRYIQLFPDVEYYGLRFGSVNGISNNTRSDIMINSMVTSGFKNQEVRVFNGHVRRAMLGIKDLCRAITAIIDNDTDVRGIYNLTSFNATSLGVGRVVASTMNVPLVEVPQSMIEQAQNVKLPPPYDFATSALKFRSTFNFEFKETLQDITQDVFNRILSVKHADHRNNGVTYE